MKEKGRDQAPAHGFLPRKKGNLPSAMEAQTPIPAIKRANPAPGNALSHMDNLKNFARKIPRGTPTPTATSNEMKANNASMHRTSLCIALAIAFAILLISRILLFPCSVILRTSSAALRIPQEHH